MAVTKNNPNARRGATGKKTYNGMEVEPVKYYGQHAGRSSYVAARQVKTNNIIMAEDGTPIKWNDIPATTSGIDNSDKK